MNKVDLKSLDGQYDILILGGGIYGAWLAYEAANLGLKVCIAEKRDWACGTSSNSSKLIHGGLRYLEKFHLGLVKKSLGERRYLSQIGPHRIQPLNFSVPHYNWFRVAPWKMKIGLSLYDWLAGKGQPVEKHKYYSQNQFLEKHSFLKKENILSGFTYGDCYTDDARYVLEIIVGAQRAGAACLSYTSGEKILQNNGRVYGAELKDLQTGASKEIHSKITINGMGPWNGELLSKNSKENPYIQLNKGIHLVMPKLPTQNAFLILAESDGRVFFLIPWYNRTLLGTTDTLYKESMDNLHVEDREIDYLLQEANNIFDSNLWSRDDIQGKFVGVRALKKLPNKKPGSVTRDWSWEQPLENLYITIGGKLTSSRADANKFIRTLSNKLNHNSGSSLSQPKLNFPWAPETDFKKWKIKKISQGISLGLSELIAENCTSRYGTQIEFVFKILKSNSELSQPIFGDLPFCKAEIIHCVENENVVRLDDLIRRRIPLAILTPMTEELLWEIAKIASPHLNWSEKFMEKEIEEALVNYQ